MENNDGMTLTNSDPQTLNISTENPEFEDRKLEKKFSTPLAVRNAEENKFIYAEQGRKDQDSVSDDEHLKITEMRDSDHPVDEDENVKEEAHDAFDPDKLPNEGDGSSDERNNHITYELTPEQRKMSILRKDSAYSNGNQQNLVQSLQWTDQSPQPKSLTEVIFY